MKGIYQYIDTKNNEIVYIGKDSYIDEDRRHKQHYAPSNYDSQQINRVLQNNPNRYKYDIIYAGNFDKDLLNILEVNSIAEFKRMHNGNRPKFNFTDGGEDNPMNYEENRKKVSQSGPKNGMYGKGHLISGPKNGMYKKRHTQSSRIKMSRYQQSSRIEKSRHHNTSGILNVSCRKDGCNVYRYYDKDGKRKSISSMDINVLKEKVLAQGLEWTIIDADLANNTLSNRNHNYDIKYHMWDTTYCSYNKGTMFTKTNNGNNPRRCFYYRYGSYKLPIGMQLDFITCEILHDLIQEEI